MIPRHLDIVVILEWVLCLVLAGIFAAAAIPKILDPAAFALSVHQYGVLPSFLANPVAIYLPWLEICCAAALALVPAARPGALWIVIFLLVVFAAALGVTVLRGETISCGCFGKNGEPSSGWPGILRNAGLAALALAALKTCRR
jgi:hypothetical protein